MRLRALLALRPAAIHVALAAVFDLIVTRGFAASIARAYEALAIFRMQAAFIARTAARCAAFPAIDARFAAVPDAVVAAGRGAAARSADPRATVRGHDTRLTGDTLRADPTAAVDVTLVTAPQAVGARGCVGCLRSKAEVGKIAGAQTTQGQQPESRWYAAHDAPEGASTIPRRSPRRHKSAANPGFW